MFLLKVSLFIFVAVGCLEAKPQDGILDRLFGNECRFKDFPEDGSCAILYDDDGCEGWEHRIGQSYRKLSFWYRNDAESVKVKRGCVFTGYDHHGRTEEARGKKVVIDARNTNKPFIYRDLDDDELNDDITAVDCRCEERQNMPVFEDGQRPDRFEIQASTNPDPKSNISPRRCPTIPAHACAILFDDENCELDDWDTPLVIAPGEERSFSLTKSLLNSRYKNEIESFVVKHGCVLEAYDDSDFSDDGIRAVARTGNLYINLDNHNDEDFEDLDEDIESLRCNCN